MYRALIAVVIVVAVGFGGYLLYQELAEPTQVTTGTPTTGTTGTTTSSIPSPPVDVDALIARLPEGSKGAYAKKSYDQSTGITTIENLELTFTLPEAPPPPPAPPAPPGTLTSPPAPPQPLAPFPPQPAPQNLPPPSDDNGSLDNGRRFGAIDSLVMPINLAPPETEEPGQPTDTAPMDDQSMPFDQMGPDSVAPPPFTDPLNPLGTIQQDLPDIEIKTLKVTVARALLRGLDVDAFEKVFDAKRYTGPRDEAFHPLFDTVTLNGVKLSGDGKDFATISTVDGRGLVMKQFAFVPGGDNFEKQFKSEDTMGFQILGMIFDAIKLDAVSMTNFKFFANEPDAQVEYGWANYAINGIDRGKVGPAHADGITFKMNDPAAGMTLQGTQESSDADASDFSAVVPYMIKGEMPPVTQTKLITMGGGRAKNMKYVMPGFGEYAMTEITTDPVLFEWLIPSQIKFNAKGSFKADPNADPTTKDMLTQLGQSEFPFDMNFSWKYEGVSGDAKLETFALNLAGLYGLDFGLGLTGMKLSEFATEERMEKMFGELMFSGLKIIITDAGGTQKVVKIFAKESQVTEDEAREILKQQAMSMAVDPNDPVSMQVASAFAQFIQNPGRLAITAMPAQPIPFMLLMMQSEDPAALAQQINLKVEVTPLP